MYLRRQTVGFIEDDLVFRCSQEVVHVHAHPRIDALIVVAGKIDALGARLHHFMHHTPLEWHQVLGFVHDQHVEQRTVTLHHELFDHVHEVHLVGHLFVVSDHLIHDLQLLEVQTIVCVLFVEHLLH